MRRGIGDSLRLLIFTVAVTCVSRVMVFRDRLLCRIPKADAVDEACCTATRHCIFSGGNVLDAVLVKPVEQPAKAAVLICHGIGETVEHWRAVQRLLVRNGIASLVFDYSGYGRSTGWVTPEQCETDAIAAFAFLQQQMPSQPISLLGFSLGSGIAAAIVPRVNPCRLVLCAAFTSFREGVRCIALLKPFAFLLPSLWETQKTLRACALPVAVVHCGNDRLFPTSMAYELAADCPSPREAIIVPALTHNDPVYKPQLSYWAAVIPHLDPRSNESESIRSVESSS